MNGGTAKITGGSIGSMDSDVVSHIDISGGSIGRISTISGSYDITGGTFLDELYVYYDRSATMDIMGGDFMGGFKYGGGFGDTAPVNFTFYGDLSLSTPTLIGDEIYETIISGTLMDGSTISQTITCDDSFSVGTPCNGVSIIDAPVVPIPPALWLFGSGLLGLVGIARKKPAPHHAA